VAFDSLKIPLKSASATVCGWAHRKLPPRSRSTPSIRGEITEIDHILARNMRPDRMQNLVTPRQAFLADVPAGERTSREDMINAANSYFEAMSMATANLLLSPRIASGTKMAPRLRITPHRFLGRYRWHRARTIRANLQAGD
jgi:hypothetical protein